MEEMLEKLLSELSGATKVVFMGIGEEKLTDDGVGPYLISKLYKNNSDRFLFLNAGVDPMARVDEVINFKPSHFVLFDTCTFNGPPGTIAILKRDNIAEHVPISSHTIPVHIVIDFLTEKIPGLKSFMIGFVPESLEGFDELQLYKRGELSIDELNENEELPFFEIQLTETIQNAADQIIGIIIKIMDKI
jgi:hydrogenase maturation protease